MYISCEIYIYIILTIYIYVFLYIIRNYNYSRKLFIANDLLGNNYSTIVATSLAHCPSVFTPSWQIARIQGRQMLIFCIVMCYDVPLAGFSVFISFF